MDTSSAFSINATMDESFEKWNPTNPLLLSPVISCFMKLLNFEGIKNCRLVCHEWASTGRPDFVSRGTICFESRSGRRPVDYNSLFENSGTVFSAFKFSGNTGENSTGWNIDELTTFFDEEQKSIKELEMDLFSLMLRQRFDLSCWISKSPLVQKDAKYMTKLSIKVSEKESGQNLHIPLNLIAHIKDLTLRNCRINLEAGLKICAVKLYLKHVKFFLDGIKLNRVLINNIVDFCKAKEVSLRSDYFNYQPICVVDLSGNTVMEKLGLNCCEVLNGRTSQWVIEKLATKFVPYSLHREMKIKELFLSRWDSADLFTLPTSIQKLALHDVSDSASLHSSQPTVFENLQYLNYVDMESMLHPAYLAKFMHCPQLTHLKVKVYPNNKMNYRWLPKYVKTLTLEDYIICWDDDNDLRLEKLIFSRIKYKHAILVCRRNIRADDVIIHYLDHKINEHLVELLKIRKTSSFCKRLFIGELKWGEQQLEDSLLKEHVDVKSSFYVFENEEKGRALSKEAFFELADIPKHIEVKYTFV